MKRSLIVNADDYGRSPAVSEGIRAAHRSGIVSSTTVMINLPGAADQMRAAQTEAPDLALGLHLNLTYGKPCASTEEIPSLVTRDGRFPAYRDWLARRDRINVDHVAKEFKAQISKSMELHPALDHLDSHQHVAVFPEIWPIFLELAVAFNLGVRLPCPQSLVAGQPTGFLPPEVDRFACEVALNQLRETNLPQTDFFLVDFFAPEIGIEHLCGILANLSPGVSELMCHPGFVDSGLQDSSYREARQIEAATLTDPQVRECINEFAIEIVRFQDLKNRMN